MEAVALRKTTVRSKKDGTEPQGIKRRKILEPKEVEVGYEFIFCLVALRLSSEEPRPSTKEARRERFKRDKNKVARQMGYDSYVELPQDAKSFEGRCSAVQKMYPGMRFSEIAKQEKAINQKLCDDLYASIMETFEQHVKKREEEERRRLLVLRMCGYNKY